MSNVGGQLGNRNRTEAGIRGWLVTGSLPKGASWIRRTLSRFRREVESSVLAVSGVLTPYASALAQSATRHEGRALLAGRWLQKQGEELTLSERLQLLKTISDATSARDDCLRRLGLDKIPTDLNPWDAIDNPPSNGPEKVEGAA